MVRNLKSFDVCIDVGAFIGYTAAHMAEKGCKVTAYEPHEDLFYCLKNNSPLSRNIQQIIGDGRTVQLVDNPVDGNAGSRRAIPGDRFTVPLDNRTLDVPTFIKIDVEGMEPAVLDGAKYLINRCKPNLLIEVNTAALKFQGYEPKDVYERIAAFGYDCEEVMGDPHSGITDLACWYRGG